MTSATICPRCARHKQPWAATCWRCYVDELVRDAEDRGYRLGYADGERDATRRARGPALDGARK